MDTESRPIKWIIDEFKNSNLYVDETFQRKSVWIRKEKISLIETIILGYPIPEIYLWETGTDPNTGNTKYSIIDGQQRIRTVSEFIENNLKLTDSGLEFPSANYKGMTFNELEPNQKSDIWSYKISVRFVKDHVTREEIVKMFLRLNKSSTTLNPQELRNAEFNGLFLKTAEHVASLDFWKNHNIFSDSEIRRMLDIQLSSTLIIFVRSGFEDETTQSAINKMYDLLNEDYPDRDKNINEISATLEKIDQLIKYNPELETPIKKKTHLYTIFTLTHTHDLNNDIEIKSFSSKLSQWFTWLSEIESGIDMGGWHEKISEYRRLSQEGVQKKANRLQRYLLLKDFMDTSSENT